MSIPSPLKKQSQSKPHPLVELRACNCSLSGGSIKSIISLKKLKALHIAYNSINELPPELFTSLSELEYLNVSSNKLETIQEPPHSCPHLVCLLLHSNSLKEIPPFPLMPAVETLDLSCNELQTMPQLQKFRRLKSLDLSHNKDIVIDVKDLDHLR
ncbi:PREDICTED: PH domain leucine-rich repeat-containing protein phosphatase 2-like [Amphimedon queenslandica]|nr:PREDICTED: PH domain leucine-rich repeat-containing protein phosphatase 2-like [Amphimedon queenslandica]|eukprot:XP_011409230.1 PREDICTED: PH domain leucine-rich repeat-containing protein phosphatase 2-like [Amphimedon queenslandica]